PTAVLFIQPSPPPPTSTLFPYTTLFRSHPRHLSLPALGRARAAPRLERRYRRGRGARRDGRGGVRELIRAAGGPSRLGARLDDARSAVRRGAGAKRRASPCLPVPSRAVGRVRRGAARALA